MPLYEYQCQSCGNRTEVIQRVSDPPLSTCEDCGGDLKKLISAPAFQFKGTGWYVTDYPNSTDPKKKKGEKQADSGNSKGKASAKPESSGGGTSSGDSGAVGKTKAERIASSS